MSTETLKARILAILNQGGDEYTRPTLAALACPSDASRRDLDKACRLIVKMDMDGEVSVRIAGGEAYYSKAKPAKPVSRVGQVDAFTRRGRKRPIVESVMYGEGVR